MTQKQSILLSIIIGTMIMGLSTKSYSQSIHEAVKTNKIEQVKLPLEGDAKLTNSLDAENNTPLILACFDPKLDTEIVALLIQFGADLSLGNTDNTTPLHLAAYTGQLEATTFLIEDLLIDISQILKLKDQYYRLFVDDKMSMNHFLKHQHIYIVTND